MDPMLPKLEEARDNLLLGEVAALLHGMSKLDHNFVLKQLKVPIINAETGKGASYATFENIPMDDASITISTKQKDRFLQNKKGQLWVWNDLEEPQRNALRTFTVTLCHERFTLTELLAFWHWLGGNEFLSAIEYAKNHKKNEIEYTNWLVDRHGFALWLLDVCHGKARVDKGEVTDGCVQQGSPLWVSSAFGSENETFVADDLTTYLKSIQFPSEGTLPLHVQQHIRNNVREQFMHGLAATQRPINEITLWDWSWSTAALYKSALAQLLLTSQPFEITQIPDDLKTPQGWRWRTLRVTVDVLGLLAQAHRLPDVLGYRRAVDVLFQEVKDMVEVTSPLGNELYRDSTGIYFSFPGVANGSQELDSIQREITDVIRGLPVIQRYPELTPIIDIGPLWGEQAVTPKWRDAPVMLVAQQRASKDAITSGMLAAHVARETLWQGDAPRAICPVCGIRPLSKPQRDGTGERIAYREQRCSICEQRAGGVRKQWESGQPIVGSLLERETIWLDEIGDEHDRIALLIGRFQLDSWLSGDMVQTLYMGKDQQGKEPSPARIMRVWRTTEEFWQKSVRDLLRKQLTLQIRKTLHITWPTAAPTERVLDGTFDGQPISLFQRENGTYLIISNPQLCSAALLKVKRDGKADLRVRADNGPWYAGEVTSFDDLVDDQTMVAAYYPTRTILTSPDQFLTLVPGTDALALAQQIAGQYASEMGKVRSRLPLDLAIVYFHRKMPLYAVIDAARRFLDERPTSEEQWTVHAEYQSGQFPISFTNGIAWDIPTTFGDGSNDTFYPYVGLWDTKAQGEYQANGRGYVHVTRLAPGQNIAVAPSHFSYLWLDASARRYAIGLPEDEVPFRTQKLHLEEIERLTTMWSKLADAKITDTQLHGAVQLLMTKRLAWGDGETFARFAADVLQRTGLSNACITADDVTSGRFFRCYDVHARIMKHKLSDSPTPEHAKEEARV